MELEDINYLIRSANRSNVTTLNFSFKELTFLPPYELYGLESLKEFDISLNQLTSLPPEISELKSLTILNSNYSGQRVK